MDDSDDKVNGLKEDCLQATVYQTTLFSGGSRGGARGAGAPPLAREKNFFI